MVTTAETGNAYTQQRRTAIGLFDHQDDLERVLNELKASVFNPEQVSLVAKDRGATREVVETTGMGGGEGAGVGAVAGGITGGLLGWLVGIGALAIPGIGPIVAAGALATTIGGAAIGAAAGGLIGALVDLGIPEEEATLYQEGVGRGGMLLTVQATSDAQLYEANEVMRRNGGTDVRTYGGATDAAHQGAPMTGVPGTTATSHPAGSDRPALSGTAVGTGLAGASAGGAVGADYGVGTHPSVHDDDRDLVRTDANQHDTPSGRYEGDRARTEPREHTVDEMAGDAAGGTIGGVSGAVAGGVLGSVGGPVGTVAGAAIGGAVGAATGVAASEAAHDEDGEDVVVGETGQRRMRPTTTTQADESVLTPEERRAINVDTRR